MRAGLTPEAAGPAARTAVEYVEAESPNPNLGDYATVEVADDVFVVVVVDPVVVEDVDAL